MLAIPLKRSQLGDFSTELSKFIKNNYSDEELERNQADIQKVNQCRINVQAVQAPNQNSFDTLQSYHSVLETLKSK